MKINFKLLAISVALIGLLAFAIPSKTEAKITSVRGYYKRSSATYVMPHYRIYRDSYKWNNWSSKYSYNPFTGKKGYKRWW